MILRSTNRDPCHVNSDSAVELDMAGVVTGTSTFDNSPCLLTTASLAMVLVMDIDTAVSIGYACQGSQLWQDRKVRAQERQGQVAVAARTTRAWTTDPMTSQVFVLFCFVCH